MYPHIYVIHTATRFYRKIKGQYTVHLPYRFGAAENTVCWSRSTVHQFNHFTTTLQTSEFMQVSPSSSMVMKCHFSWNAFLNVWKCLFSLGTVCRCAINRRPCFPLKMKHFYKWCSDSEDLFRLQLRRYDVLFRKLQRNFFLLRVFRASAEHFWE